GYKATALVPECRNTNARLYFQRLRYFKVYPKKLSSAFSSDNVKIFVFSLDRLRPLTSKNSIILGNTYLIRICLLLAIITKSSAYRTINRFKDSRDLFPSRCLIIIRLSLLFVNERTELYVASSNPFNVKLARQGLITPPCGVPDSLI